MLLLLRTETTVFIFKTIRLLGREEIFKKRAENSLKQIRHAHTSFISEKYDYKVRVF